MHHISTHKLEMWRDEGGFVRCCYVDMAMGGLVLRSQFDAFSSCYYFVVMGVFIFCVVED